MDLLLLPFLYATEDYEREHLLSELILVHAAPFVRRTLRQRLGFYVDSRGANPHNPEAEDLYHDVIAKVVERLNGLRADQDKHPINSLRQYVTGIAANACADYLRAKSPQRARLKYRIRDVLDRHPDFAVWRTDAGETVCGFSVWRAESIRRGAAHRLNLLEENTEQFKAAKFPRMDLASVPLTRVVAGVFDWLGGSVEIETLVRLLSDLLEVKDHAAESLDDKEDVTSLAASEAVLQCDTYDDTREVMRLMWDEICRLPETQRLTICLSFEDASGDDLFSLMLDARIVTLQQISEQLDLPLSRLVSLWKRAPMDNASVADELNATRQQVYKWRFLALKALRERLIAVGVRR